MRVTVGFLCFQYFPVFAQLSDDFSDGDFTHNPSWTGDTASWVVDQGQLRSNGPAITPGTLYLSTPFQSTQECRWTFFANPACALTSGNYMDVALLSDQADLRSGFRGYFVRLGGTAKEISLFRSDSSTVVKLIDGTDGLLSGTSQNPVRVKVTRDSLYRWSLEAEPLNSSSGYLWQGSATDSSYLHSGWFGLLVRYSSANRARFFFDELYAGPVPPDTLVPTLVSAEIVHPNEIRLRFNKSLDSLTLQEAGYHFIPELAVHTILPEEPSFSGLTLLLSEALEKGTAYQLIVSGINDRQGRRLRDSTAGLGLGVEPAAYELLIHEIFSKTQEQGSLPSRPFVEIYNASEKVLELEGCRFYRKTQYALFPTSTLFPGETLILCPAAAFAEYSVFGRALSLVSFPALNRNSDELSLRNRSGHLLHAVTYRDEWFDDPEKARGGWSLELIDPNNPCGEQHNWAASQNPAGASPGQSNSIQGHNPDTEAPFITLVDAQTDRSANVTFSETIDSLSLSMAQWLCQPFSAIVEVASTGHRSAVLRFDPALSQGVKYTLSVSGISDCVGNPIHEEPVFFALPDPAQPGDIILNEILFTPRVQGVVFVELYNRSSRIIDLKNWALANYSGQQISQLRPLSASALLLFPGEYLALSTSLEILQIEYPYTARERLFQMPSLPAYSRQSGRVFLVDATGTVQDDFSYSASMHFPLLSSTEGVSLERLDPNRPASDANNWHSAAESEGFATPGYRNSQYLSESENSSEVVIEPPLFSPDNDGYQDIAYIRYAFDQPGYVGNARIYNLHGQPIRALLYNELLGKTGSFSWDGLTDSREKVPVGTYLLYFEIFSQDGLVKQFKKAISVASDFR